MDMLHSIGMTGYFERLLREGGRRYFVVADGRLGYPPYTVPKRLDVRPGYYLRSIMNWAICTLAIYGVAFLPGYFVTGISKLILILLIATLLMFAVRRAPNVCRHLQACLQAACVLFSMPAVDSISQTEPSQSLAVRAEPSVSALFQRPPPLLSI